MLQAESDKLTPANALWRSIKKDHDRDPLQDPSFDMITMVGNGHDNWIYPDPEKFVNKVLRQLKALQQMRKNESTEKE